MRTEALMVARYLRIQTIFVLAIPAFLIAVPAHAYIGPGAGVSIIGAIGGLISVLFLAGWALIRWSVNYIIPVGEKKNSAEFDLVTAGPDVSSSGDTLVSGKPDRRKSFSSYAILAGVTLFGAVGWNEDSREVFFEWVHAIHFSLDGLNAIDLDWHTAPERFPVSESGVVLHDAVRAFNGYNIELSSMEHSAKLLDMKGVEKHRWELDRTAITRIYAAAGKSFPGDARGVYWRRVQPLPDGSLLVLMDNFRTTPYGIVLMKLDSNSRIVWAEVDHYHHSIDVAPDGRIVTLYQEISHQPPAFAPVAKVPFLDEGVAILSPEGVEMERISIAKAFEGTPFISHLSNIVENIDAGDPYHMNTANYITASQARSLSIAKEGDILVSLRNLNTIALLDPVSRKITWASSGNWVGQHEPVITSQGNILLYDNAGGEFRTSRIVEWNPRTQEFEWIENQANGHRILSLVYGAVDELPNGNRLVSSSQSARALEFDKSGQLVWEWRQPRRYGPEKNQTSNLMEMIRVPVDFFDHNFAYSETLSGRLENEKLEQGHPDRTTLRQLGPMQTVKKSPAQKAGKTELTANRQNLH